MLKRGRGVFLILISLFLIFLITFPATAIEYNLTYDANGNMISGFGKNFSYNGFNHLVAITNSSTGVIIARNSYDADGNRFKKIEYNIDSAKNNRTTYYVSDNFIQVRLTNNTIYNETYYYVNGKLIAKEDDLGNKQFYHGDHLGSTSLVTNQSGWIVKLDYKKQNI